LSWGFTDEYTWLGTDEYPLPFDVDYRKKPAYTAMLDVLNSKE
jgi:GH35 family endo-1,4-beta-xylanase